MHALGMPSIKCDTLTVMSRFSSALVTSRVSVHRKSLSYRRFESAVVAEHGLRSARFVPSVSGDNRNMPNILLRWVLSYLRCIPPIEIP